MSLVGHCRLEIEAPFQWTTSRKWHVANRMVTKSVMSREPDRSALLVTPICLGTKQQIITKTAGNTDSVLMEYQMHWGIKWSCAR